MPSNINNFATQTGQPGVSIEPTIALDEEANYINHLHQLRRVNAGDDLTDLAGYGLYLLRMPITLMPGPESRKGKGAIVTVEARHELTDDLLPNVFRDVAILDLTYALTQIVNEKIHRDIYEKCHLTKPNERQMPPGPPPPDYYRSERFNPEYYRPPDVPTGNGTGPNPTILRDLQLILGSLKDPTGLQKTRELAGDKSVPENIRSSPSYLYNIYKSDRLSTLIESMKTAQSDPYRHDPQTLKLFQDSILDAWRYMRDNAAQGCGLFQVPMIEELGTLLMRRDYSKLRIARERFLYDLYCFRNALPAGSIPKSPAEWEEAVEPSDILAFALLVQFLNVDRQLKWDMKYMSQRRGCNCGDVEGLSFYEFDPSPEARNAFKDYVACKWPLHIYSVDPVLDQQNVLDAYSRRTELQLALAVGVATGQFNFKNATSFARQLDLDLQTVGLNRTSVGFGAGETTFGWMFYPRV